VGVLPKSATYRPREDCRVVSPHWEITRNPEGSSAAEVGLRIDLHNNSQAKWIHNMQNIKKMFRIE
jgi:hypothetical protein